MKEEKKEEEKKKRCKKFMAVECGGAPGNYEAEP